jgi:hypothetical protein
VVGKVMVGRLGSWIGLLLVVGDCANTDEVHTNAAAIACVLYFMVLPRQNPGRVSLSSADAEAKITASAESSVGSD